MLEIYRPLEKEIPIEHPAFFRDYGQRLACQTGARAKFMGNLEGPGWHPDMHRVTAEVGWRCHDGFGAPKKIAFQNTVHLSSLWLEDYRQQKTLPQCYQKDVGNILRRGGIGGVPLDSHDKWSAPVFFFSGFSWWVFFSPRILVLLIWLICIDFSI